MSGSLASWQNCAKVRSSWTRWKDGLKTRVTGFLWDRGRDRLWRQGIDLIGDDRGGQGGKGIEDGAMFGQSEGGEFLDMTDDGFDDVAPVEQRLVEERHR